MPQANFHSPSSPLRRCQLTPCCLRNCWASSYVRMLAAAPPGGGGAGEGVATPPDAGGLARFDVLFGRAGSGLPTMIPGAVPRTAPVEDGLVGETVSVVKRRFRASSEVAVSPPATGAVPGVV